MIVIVIVGVLSAVALPNFLGVKDKAEAGAAIGGMMGVAKECATGQIIGSGGTTTTSAGGAEYSLSADCTGAAAVTMAVTLTKVPAGIECGKLAATGAANLSTADDTAPVCTLTITTDGKISGLWT